MLRAITKKEGRLKKHRAVAASPAAGFNDIDKNLSSKIITGLFVLLLFHIFAVAAIMLHSKFNKNLIKDRGDGAVALSHAGVDHKGAYDLIKEEQSPKISKSESYTWVNPGDTYQSISERINCDVNELKRLNDNRAIQTGRAIKTPPRQVNVISPELEAIGNSLGVTVEQVQPDVHRIVEVRPTVINTETPQNSSNFINHKFKNGETLWALSRKYKVSVADIQNANPTLKPTSIRANTNIKIPRQ